jgi:tetratricopeptide (TPR) repeat protein
VFFAYPISKGTAMTRDFQSEFDNRKAPGIKIESGLADLDACRAAFRTSKVGPSAKSAFLECCASQTGTEREQPAIALAGRGSSLLPEFGGEFVKIDDKDKKAEDKKVEDKLQSEVLALTKERDYKKAEESGKKLLALRESTYGKDSPEVATTLHLLGATCAYDGRYKDAKAYYARGVEVSKVAFGKESDNLMTAFHVAQVANMDVRLDQLKDAASGYKEAVRIYNKLESGKQNLGDKVLANVAETYIQYGKVLEKLGDKDEAKKQTEQGQEILKRVKSDKK